MISPNIFLLMAYNRMTYMFFFLLMLFIMFPKEFIMMCLTLWLYYSLNSNESYDSNYPTFYPSYSNYINNDSEDELIDLDTDEDTEDEDSDDDCLVFEDIDTDDNKEKLD